MDGLTGFVDLADGRKLAYLDGGDPHGAVVVGLHGTPGCRLSRWPDDRVYASVGVRYITTDRAGYGRSTRHRGRDVADEARDVLALAEHLDLDQFAIVGGSGGGPHALACAALISDRVRRVACQSSIAPLGVEGLSRAQWIAGMSADVAAELEWAEAGEDALAERLSHQQASMERSLREDPGRLLGEGLSETDERFLRRPDVVGAFGRILAEQAVHGVWGSVDDTLAFSRQWGFRVASIAIPVLVTHGVHDASAPIAHGRWLAANIPTAELRVSETGGHLPEDPEAEIASTMAWLLG